LPAGRKAVSAKLLSAAFYVAKKNGKCKQNVNLRTLLLATFRQRR